MSTQERWLKPSEVTEPGVYWVADRRGGHTPEPPFTVYAVNLVRDKSGDLYSYGLHGSAYLLSWAKQFRLLGPIKPPEYTGDKS